MTGDDESNARLEHQQRFLLERGLVSREMDDWNRQLWLLERLVGKDPSKLDPQLRGRLRTELENATSSQLREAGLFDEWLESWEARDAEDTGSSEVPLTTTRTLPVRL